MSQEPKKRHSRQRQGKRRHAYVAYSVDRMHNEISRQKDNQIRGARFLTEETKVSEKVEKKTDEDSE